MRATFIALDRPFLTITSVRGQFFTVAWDIANSFVNEGKSKERRRFGWKKRRAAIYSIITSERLHTYEQVIPFHDFRPFSDFERRVLWRHVRVIIRFTDAWLLDFTASSPASRLPLNCRRIWTLLKALQRVHIYGRNRENARVAITMI